MGTPKVPIQMVWQLEESFEYNSFGLRDGILNRASVT